MVIRGIEWICVSHFFKQLTLWITMIVHYQKRDNDDCRSHQTGDPALETTNPVKEIVLIILLL